LTQLVRSAVDDEDARDVGDVLALLQTVLHERRPRFDEIHDQVRKPDEGR
jgi:hypothetical protein